MPSSSAEEPLDGGDLSSSEALLMDDDDTGMQDGGVLGGDKENMDPTGESRLE